MSDAIIIAGIRERDERIISGVIARYSRLLWPIVSSVLKNVGTEEDVEECVADVFIDLWEHPDRFDPGKGSLKSWLCMVTRCRAIDCYRALSRHSTVPLEGAMMAGRMGMQDALLQEETNRELAAAVNALADMERDILIKEPIDQVVMHYANNAKLAGLDGVVCSPLEAGKVKEVCGKEFMTVTPGVRFADGEVGDQVRVTTPERAKEIGSDYIVVGRPITQADDPVAAYRRCVNEFIG